MDMVEQEMTHLDVVIHRHGDENVTDISPKNVHKWRALQDLGVSENTYIAFGNDTNDITMFQKAAHSVMIGYHDKLASYTTDTVSLEGDYETRSEEHTSELQSRGHLVCCLLLDKNKYG